MKSEPVRLGRRPHNEREAVLELLRWVGEGTQAVQIFSAFQRGEQTGERLVVRAELKTRGWTKVKKFLPDPVAIRPKRGGQTTYWLLSTIKKIEATTAWQAERAKASARQQRRSQRDSIVERLIKSAPRKTKP